MADSDEEGEIFPQCVSTYHLVDQNDSLISFADLPVKWNENEVVGTNSEVQVYLCGTIDDGLRKFYRQVIAWKFELSYVQPEIWMLSKNKSWIQLQNPRKSFINFIRTILIAVHGLHFIKKNYKASMEAVRDYLRTAFSFFEVEPSQRDLGYHMPLIREAVKRDNDLAKSEFLRTFMAKFEAEESSNECTQEIKKSDFIVYSNEDEDNWNEEAYIRKDSFGLCAICDDGGNILFCEGRCLRAFHPTIASGIHNSCKSLGYTQAQVNAIPTFMCKNCKHQQHQCFACGMLGSSDTSCQEVFPCVLATCGNFYHPECVVKLLHPDNESLGEQLRVKIAAGESFTCPAHKCFVCKRSEDKNVYDLQFATCRRCPKAYHRKCLPREIAFESTANNLQRAWTGLLPNKQILIYCLEHEISGELMAPARNHLIFPGVKGKRKKLASELLSAEEKFMASKQSLVSETLTNKIVVKQRNFVEYSGTEVGISAMKTEKGSPRRDFYALKKPNTSDAGRKSLKDTSGKSKPLFGDNSSLLNFRLHLFKPDQHSMGDTKMRSITLDKHMRKTENSSEPLLDAEDEKHILALMEDASKSVTMEDIRKRYKVPSSHASHSKTVMNKTCTLGFVSNSVKAIETAAKMLDEGFTVEEAKTVCGPEVLTQIFQCKRKLDVYLAPLLHGSRYSSFGRHFTGIEKLKEIVARLSCYVQSGDTIVDFCCGANDFSCLMREKLDKMGKTCSFRNYDLLPPKNDFCFEKRDWMTVQPEELPEGSQLIMGLNPPFGVKASLANKFIDQALKFKPKLLILIVPKETERLDEKASYDLIWEDDALLSGKSFYLPGSVDENDNQMEQWNVRPPPLYLWSRSDWTARHKETALERAHLAHS